MTDLVAEQPLALPESANYKVLVMNLDYSVFSGSNISDHVGLCCSVIVEQNI